MYTVVYKYNDQYYVVRYLSDSHVQLSDDTSYAQATQDSYAAEVWGTEIARWGDD